MKRFCKWFANLQITTKLRLVIWLITLTALIFTGALLITNIRVALRHIVLERLTTQADIIAANSTAALSFQDRNAAYETLSALSVDNGVIAAVILDRHGELFAIYPEGKQGLEKFATLQSSEHVFTQSELIIKRPILFYGETIGFVGIEYSRKQMTRELWLSTGIIVLFLAGAAFLAVLITALLQRGITQPIQELAALANRVAKNQDYSIRATWLSKDEIGTLAKHFNKMLRQIQTRDKRLEAYNRHLEEMVTRRTEQLEDLNRQLEHKAQHDVLTQLPNRALFEDRLLHAIVRAGRNQEKVALLFVDLDHFKRINDAYGHEAGDQVLLRVARRLEDCVRSEDTVARFAGDEFIILLSGLNFMLDVNVVAAKIALEMSKPIDYKSTSLNISASIGVSVYPDDAENAELLLKAADVAMYHAKNQGRNRYQFYSSEMNIRIGERKNLETELFRAIEENELLLLYQPVMDLRTGAIDSLETLLRWRHPRMGLLAPAKFLPYAEESGLISKIDHWMLSQVSMQAKAWEQQGSPIHVRVNLAMRDFLRKEFFDLFFNILQKNALSPERISVEIKEHVLMDETPLTVELLHMLRKSCIQLSVDDFGTGYSSLYALQHCPVDFVKIDGTYIHEIHDNEENDMMIRAIVAMAHSLNLTVIAEGVESYPQLAYLKQLSCELAQGYLFYKPMHREQVEKLIL